ncbi:MAG: hypothetical protein HON53_03260, partial [Planctomycetaceae bacterium]|nr:hypothetical protein [Planctomycetaceae bacterium]
LGNVGAAALPARTALAKAQKTDDRPYVRAAAGKALEQINAAPTQNRWWPWALAILATAAAAGVLWFRRRNRLYHH